MFVLCDEVVAESKNEMELNFTCLGPLEMLSRHAVSKTNRNHLIIYPQATSPLQYRSAVWGTQWEDIPSYRYIVAAAAPVKRCVFLTVLAPCAAAGESPEVRPLDVEGGLAVRVRSGPADNLFLFNGRDTLSLEGLETDARMAALVRSDGTVTGAAMCDGSALRTDGEGEILQAEGSGLSGLVR